MAVLHEHSFGSVSNYLLIQLSMFMLVCANCESLAQDGYKKYMDGQGRFVLSYPATMQVEATNPDHVQISHPKASLRITLLIEKRPRKATPDVNALVEAFKKKLKEDTRDSSILEEGKLTGLEGAQGYLICSFKDGRGSQIIQLVQYYLTEDRLLQMIIADRPEGFVNVEKVIRHIHRSLKILRPKLDGTVAPGSKSEGRSLPRMMDHMTGWCECPCFV